MPRLIDYAARFTFLREAAFEVVLLDGVSALSRRGLARRLRTSASTVRRSVSPEASLAQLAAEQVLGRRREARWDRPRQPPGEAAADAVWLLRRAVPDCDELVPVELVWWRLLLGRTPESATDQVRAVLCPDGAGSDLATRFEVATTGGSARLERGRTVATDELREALAEAGTRQPDPHLDRILGEHRAQVASWVAQALRRLGIPDARMPAEELFLSRFLAGVSLAVVTGATTPDEAVGELTAYVDGLAAPGRRHGH